METYEKIELGIIVIILLILIESVILMTVEGWDFFTAFYTAVVTISTVGYGDYTPQTFLTYLQVLEQLHILWETLQVFSLKGILENTSG